MLRPESFNNTYPYTNDMARATNARGDCDSLPITDSNGIGFRTGDEVRIDGLREINGRGSIDRSSCNDLGLSEGVGCSNSVMSISKLSRA